jgi:hypothetical protein
MKRTRWGAHTAWDQPMPYLIADIGGAHTVGGAHGGGRTRWGRTRWGRTRWGRTRRGRTRWGRTRWGRTRHGINPCPTRSARSVVGAHGMGLTHALPGRRATTSGNVYKCMVYPDFAAALTTRRRCLHLRSVLAIMRAEDKLYYDANVEEEEYSGEDSSEPTSGARSVIPHRRRALRSWLENEWLHFKGEEAGWNRACRHKT